MVQVPNVSICKACSGEVIIVPESLRSRTVTFFYFFDGMPRFRIGFDYVWGCENSGIGGGRGVE
jgi:hypothetical protein